MDGFINLLKPPGMTSHDAVGFIRRTLGEKHVGHAGTLDPGAAGVLPIAVGKAARLIEYLDDVNKSYRAEMFFGIETDSGDDTGIITAECHSFVMPEKDIIDEVFKKFLGKISQTPPAYSAIKINGRRACDLIRQNFKVDIPRREVVIYQLKLIEQNDLANTLLFDVTCSKGTYIRSLCQDMGREFNIPSTMSFLVRTAVGDFKLENSLTVEEVKTKGAASLLPVDICIKHLKKYDINPTRKTAFCNGLATTDKSFNADNSWTDDVLLRVYSEKEFLGIGHYDVKNKTIVPDKVIAICR